MDNFIICGDTEVSGICQGQVFRADVSIYRTSKGFAKTIKLNRSVKLSCPGCEHCAWQFNELDAIEPDWALLGLHEAEDKGYYTLSICNISQDWESGVVDGWDLKLVPFNNTQKVLNSL